jgi:hypothetical protein
MQLYQMLKAQLQKHNWYFFVNTGLPKYLVNADGECKMAFPKQKKAVLKENWDSFLYHIPEVLSSNPLQAPIPPKTLEKAFLQSRL